VTAAAARSCRHCRHSRSNSLKIVCGLARIRGSSPFSDPTLVLVRGGTEASERAACEAIAAKCGGFQKYEDA